MPTGTQTTDIEEDDSVPPVDQPRRSVSLVRTQRTLQVVLGLFWLLDAGLQFQPFMFGKGFTTTFLLNNAEGQPDVIRWIITNVGNFVGPHVAVWNTFFALIQVAIGAGLLFRRTVRPALAISFFWAFGVWFFGEGLGLIFTGSASALTGAPGSVFMYGLIGLMAWPRRPGRADESVEVEQKVGVASSAAAQGIGGAVTPLAVWSGFWALAAVLFLLPNNRTQTSVSSAISGMSSGEPSAYAHFLTHFGNHFGSVGTQGAWLLAMASLVIGAGPLGGAATADLPSGRGAALAGLLGDRAGSRRHLHGVGHRPQHRAPGRPPRPLDDAERRSRCILRSPSAGVVAALEPGPRHRRRRRAGGRSGAQRGVSGTGPGDDGHGDVGHGGNGRRHAFGGHGQHRACTAGNGGTTRSGLDLTNSPYMIMGGNNGMNMNGADASAAAGFNSTKANWSYTGPAFPTALAHELLADGENGPDQIHMAVTGCAAEPTFSQQINATQYVQSTTEAVAPYASLAAATAAGYVAVSPVDYPVVYYVNPGIEAANAAAKRTLSPEHVDGLIYARTPSGQEVLAAAMYVLPSTLRKAADAVRSAGAVASAH